MTDTLSAFGLPEIWAAIIAFSVLTYIVLDGFDLGIGILFPFFKHEDERTMAMNTLVVMEIFHVFFIRNIYGTSLTWQAVRGTKVVWICVISVTMAQFAITYLPFMQSLFGDGVPLLVFAAILAVISAGYAILGGLRAVAVMETYAGIGVLAIAAERTQKRCCAVPRHRHPRHPDLWPLITC